MMSQRMAMSGLRVLAACSGTTSNDLTFAGLFGILDPPRDNVPSAIQRMRRTGIQVCMITGDAKETAISIGERIGLYDASKHKSLSGADIDSLSVEQLARVIEDVTVFYRTTPRFEN